MLARFAAFIADEPPRPSPAPQTQTLAALVSRLDQLSDLRQSESCRAHQAHEASVKASIGAVIEVLDSQIDAIQHTIDALIASDPILTEKASLLRSCKGVGPKNAQMILARLPEIGALDRRKIAALVGVAPITCKSGSSINPPASPAAVSPCATPCSWPPSQPALITRPSSPSATGSKPTANRTSSSSSPSFENSSSPSTQ